jgi:hypothetical protein
VVTGFGRE